MRILPVLLIAGLLVVSTPALLAEGPGLAGTWKNPEMELVLAPGPGGYTGELTYKGNTYPVRGREVAGNFEGSFRAGADEFPLRAVRTGDTLTLDSAGNVFVLKLEGAGPPPNPLDPGGGAPAPAPASARAILDQLQDLGTPQAPVEWTIVVYLDGDNNLEGPGLIDLNEMEAGLPGSGVEVIVLADRAKGFDSSDGDWTGARVYRIRPDGDMNAIRSPVLADLGEINMGDGAVLAAFLSGALKAFPARHHALVMWDHGGGWAAMANDDDNGAGGSDYLELTEAADAVALGLKGTRVARLDLLGFDMCLMAQLETAVQMAPLARYMIASQALEPGDGWPYHAALPAFAANGGDVPAIGRAIVSAYHHSYLATPQQSTTLSLLDLDRAKQVTAALDTLLLKLTGDLERIWTTTARALFFSESYMDRSDFRKGPNGVNSLDLLDVLKRIRHNAKPFPAEAEYQAFLREMNAFVVAKQNNEPRRLSQGVSIYSPVAAKSVNPEYAGVALARESRWLEFLGTLHRLQARDTRPPVVRSISITDHQDQPVAALKPMAGQQFKGVIEGNNIILTEVWDGVRDAALGGLKVTAQYFLTDDLWILRYEEAKKTGVHDFDLLMPVYRDGKNELHTEFDGLTFWITNGRERATGTIEVTSLDSSDVFTVPCLLNDPAFGEKPVFGKLVFDANFLNLIGIIGQFSTGDGQIQAKPLRLDSIPAGAKITPLHVLVKADGVQYATGGDLPWTGSYECVLDLTPAGDYESLLIVETMAGVSTQASFRYKVEDDPELRQLAEGWDLFKPEMMEGTWDLFVLDGNNDQIATGTTYTIRTVDGDANAFKVRMTTQDPADDNDQLWILDRRGFPNFRMIVLDKDGKPEGPLAVPAFFGVVDGKAKIIGKMINIGGMTWLWVKRGMTKTDADRIKPVEVPEPVPLR